MPSLKQNQQHAVINGLFGTKPFITKIIYTYKAREKATQSVPIWDSMKHCPHDQCSAKQHFRVFHSGASRANLEHPVLPLHNDSSERMKTIVTIRGKYSKFTPAIMY